MTDSDRSFLSKRLLSFKWAFQGVCYLLRTQPNSWVHAVATALAIGMGLYYSVTRWEWVVLVLCMGGVWAAEAFNTALECLCDTVHPEQHPGIKNAKDVAAAAVLLMALAALAIGVWIFLPYLTGAQGAD